MSIKRPSYIYICLLIFKKTFTEQQSFEQYLFFKACNANLKVFYQTKILLLNSGV